MGVVLIGNKQLVSKLDNLASAFPRLTRHWSEDTTRLARTGYARHARTGRQAGSVRVLSATSRRAVVGVWFTARFIDLDTKAHAILARRRGSLRFQQGGQTIFARKAFRRARAGTPVLGPAGQQALERSPIGDELAAAWSA